jgi:two-component system, LuxR family, sensor kinase FixL
MVPKPLASLLFPATAAVCAILIFVVDAVTPVQAAVAVLYVVVVLIAGHLWERRTLWLVAGSCVALTLLAYVLQHGTDHEQQALLRAVVSVSAIVITTALAARNQSISRVLLEQTRLLDLTHESIFVRDRNDVITYWNHGAEELYGWERSEAIGKICHDLLQTKFSAPLADITAELTLTNRWEGELIHTRSDGVKVVVASRWARQYDEAGRPTAVLETNRDITERKRAQDAVREVQAELAHVARITTMGEMAASIAHEVNQPLSGVVLNGNACLRWLTRDPPNLVEAREAVERIVRDGKRASEVIARIRNLSKRSAEHKEPLNLNEVIAEVGLFAEIELRRARVVFRTRLAQDLPRVVADRIQLQQVVLNLVLNAIEAMSGVDAARRELSIESGRDGAAGVRVSVRDLGAGVAAEDLNRIFDAFHSTKRGGIGLGLSISRSIIENHGGRLWAERNQGPGTTFLFTL